MSKRKKPRKNLPAGDEALLRLTQVEAAAVFGVRKDVIPPRQKVNNVPKAQANRYSAILERIFDDHYKAGLTEFTFRRTEFESVATDLGIVLPKNLGDVIYSFRFRNDLPASIARKAPSGKTWAIKLAGRGVYRMKLVTATRIVPTVGRVKTKIPDATPEIIAANALGDEQAVLARVRYNRLIDIFLGVTAYSLQNHLRTTVQDIGQVEIDEVYVAVDRHGAQYVVPVQAKGGSDQLGIVQIEQDVACCADKFKGLAVRPVAAQFLPDGTIVLFELTIRNDEVLIVQERHYELVSASEISASDLVAYEQEAKAASQLP